LGEIPTRGGYYDPYLDEVAVFKEKGTFWYFIVLEHEECHRKQNYEGRLSEENLFWNELECNIKQWTGVINWWNFIN